MTVIFNTMYDPDVEDMSEAIDAVTLYEWTIVDGSYGEGMYENWRIVNNLQKTNDTHVSNGVFFLMHFW
jgi:predicted dehydrogenase